MTCYYGESTKEQTIGEKRKNNWHATQSCEKILAAVSMKGILGKCTRGLMGSHPNLLNRRKKKQAFAKRIGNRP